LRADVTELQAVIPKVSAHTVSYDTVHAFLTKMAADVDDVWYHDYTTLQSDIAAWQPPGAFEVHAAALRQTYAAFLAGGHEIEGGVFVLEDTGPAGAKEELIQASGEFQTAISELSGHPGPEAQAAWETLSDNPADQALRSNHPPGRGGRP
jgi:hypothetical protein